ncbi:MAG TPA: nicotinate phosphoribosyltransferase, partial [Clostridiales bacterium]|nr:nicotinate phosphoribosyltransferase [Clostridiales bacterium]
MEQLTGLDDIKDIKISEERKLHSANHEEILSGATTDVYFLRTMDILKHMNLDDQIVTAEIFARRPGILAGEEEVKNILKNKNLE